MAIVERAHVVAQEEGKRILDEAARKYLNMSAEEFLAAWDGGTFADRVDTPEVMRVASLIHFAR